jgi:hypothetical protein
MTTIETTAFLLILLFLSGTAWIGISVMVGIPINRTIPVRLSRKIRSLRAWTRQSWAKGLLLVGSLLTRKGMNLLMREGDSSPLSSDSGDPFDDFVTRYLEKHG